MPTASTTLWTKRRPSAYCRIFGSSPSSRRISRSNGSLPAPLVERAAHLLRRRHHRRSYAVHDESPWPSSRVINA